MVAPNEQTEKKGADDSIEIKSPFLTALDNFWYYNKWKVIIGIFLLFTFGVLFFQSCQKTEPDMMILVAGNDWIAAQDQQTVADVISNRYLSDDLNHDGKKEVDVRFYSVYSEDEIKQKIADGENVSTAALSQTASEYRTYVTTGDTAVCILSPDLYAEMVAYDRLSTLTLADGSVVAGVRMGETSFYLQNEAAAVIPSDWYICLLRPYVYGNTGKAAQYAAMQNIVLAMISN